MPIAFGILKNRETLREIPCNFLSNYGIIVPKRLI